MDIDRWRSRLPVRRAADGELVGWTVSDLALDDGELVDAVNPVGHVVSKNVPLDTAIAVLEERGLASLSVPYWALAPTPLTSRQSLDRPKPEWTWRRMVMTQLDDSKVWIRPAYPTYPERVVEVSVALPADGVLTDRPPEQGE